MACCPLQAEAIALQRGVDLAISLSLSDCSFLTDCLTLAENCAGLHPPTEVDWRAHSEIFDIWKKLKCNQGFTCSHISRELNETADSLAKRGRKMGDSYGGFTYPTFPLFTGA
ncbi:hypothetical protein FCM35_KLT06476 [Carex littledalei]|uniref:RNase H type-1 domain-containing protein n=1 Tax=Carex littledalei TaxID=544730 RepID=A0A833VIG5_9POAL|nr:hypothetical protein FCM35_KLT06476 [Carex littledalei]